MEDKTLIKWSNILKKSGEVILYVIAVAIICGLLITVFIGKPSEIKKTFKTNNKIEKVIDSIKQDQAFIISRIYEQEKNQVIFNDAINEVKEGMNKNNLGILKLQKIYNAKINNANTFNITQLDSFFTNRYKDFYIR